MSYLDKVTVGSTTYDIQDTKAQGDIVDLKSAEKYYLSTTEDYGTLEVGTINSNGATSSGTSVQKWRRTTPIQVKKGSTVTVTNYGYGTRMGLYSNPLASTAAANIETKTIAKNTTDTYTASQDGYLRICFETDGENIPTTIPSQITTFLITGSAIKGNPKVIFVATDGDNDNDGSYNLPVATINQALKLGANVVVMKSGTYAQQIDRSLINSDLLIIGGTSLAVYPAAGFLSYYRGDRLVLINRDPTPRDSMARLIIRDPIGQVLGAMPDA